MYGKRQMMRETNRLYIYNRFVLF